MFSTKNVSQIQKKLSTRQKRETNIRIKKLILFNYMFHVIQMITSFLRSHPTLHEFYHSLYNLLIECFFNSSLLVSNDLESMQTPSISDQQLLNCDEDNDFVKNDLDHSLIQAISDHLLIKNYNLDDDCKKDKRLILQYIKLHNVESQIVMHFIDYLKDDLMKKLRNIVTLSDYADQFEKTLIVHVQHLFLLVQYLQKNITIFATYPPERFQKKLNDLINYDKHWVNLVEQSHCLDEVLDMASI